MWINLGARNLRNLGTSDVVVRARQSRLPVPRRTRAAENGEASPLEDKQPHKQDDHNHETDGVDVIHDGRLIAVCKLII